MDKSFKFIIRFLIDGKSSKTGNVHRSLRIFPKNLVYQRYSIRKRLVILVIHFLKKLKVLVLIIFGITL